MGQWVGSAMPLAPAARVYWGREVSIESLLQHILLITPSGLPSPSEHRQEGLLSQLPFLLPHESVNYCTDKSFTGRVLHCCICHCICHWSCLPPQAVWSDQQGERLLVSPAAAHAYLVHFLQCNHGNQPLPGNSIGHAHSPYVANTLRARADGRCREERQETVYQKCKFLVLHFPSENCGILCLHGSPDQFRNDLAATQRPP